VPYITAQYNTVLFPLSFGCLQLIQASLALSSLPGVGANVVTELRSASNVQLLQSLLHTLTAQAGEQH